MLHVAIINILAFFKIINFLLACLFYWYVSFLNYVLPRIFIKNIYPKFPKLPNLKTTLIFCMVFFRYLFLT